jgi:hypothetical protein
VQHGGGAIEGEQPIIGKPLEQTLGEPTFTASQLDQRLRPWPLGDQLGQQTELEFSVGDAIPPHTDELLTDAVVPLGLWDVRLFGHLCFLRIEVCPLPL